MRIAVFGGSGQVATELAALPGTFRITRETADFARPETVARAVSGLEADAIVNAAAYTAVDAAEADEGTATLVNGTAVATLAREAARRGIPLIHISTDYVFDGSGTRAWRPEDRPAPLGAYGRSKLAGEEAVRAAGGAHAILRTSWVFSPHGANFVKTMLRLGGERDTVRVVADQVGGPTPARAIASAAVTIAGALSERPELSGTYHFSGAPDTSWAGFARAIFDAAGLEVIVEEIPTSAYPTPARRPPNSRLECSATEAAFGLTRPDWAAELPAVIAEIRRPESAR